MTNFWKGGGSNRMVDYSKSSLSLSHEEFTCDTYVTQDDEAFQYSDANLASYTFPLPLGQQSRTHGKLAYGPPRHWPSRESTQSTHSLFNFGLLGAVGKMRLPKTLQASLVTFFESIRFNLLIIFSAAKAQ